jgi:tetratricopeptide (TPR) repeat protein
VLRDDAPAVFCPSLDSKGSTVPKAGRNDPCPCGSGKKYKHCCLEKDRAAELAPAIAQRVALQAHKANQAAQQKDYQAELLQSQATWQEAQALDAASNVVIDLIRAGRLDEAEQAARELLVRYPEVHDGYDRLGMVHEARGQFREAADCYGKVIEFARANAENYDTGFVDRFLELIVRCQARATEAERAVNDIDRPG